MKNRPQTMQVKPSILPSLPIPDDQNDDINNPTPPKTDPDNGHLIPPAPNPSLPVSVLDPFLLVIMGLHLLSDWLGSWFSHKTYVDNRPDLFMTIGQTLKIDLLEADDEIEVWFNNDFLGSLKLGEDPITLVSGEVKEGMNGLIVRIKNSGRFNWKIAMKTCSTPGEAEIKELTINESGNDIFQSPDRVYKFRCWGMKDSDFDAVKKGAKPPKHIFTAETSRKSHRGFS